MASKTKAMSREELSTHVAKRIAESMPDGFVEACIEEAIRASIVDFKIDEYALRQIMKDAIADKTKELLRTKYAKQVEAQADVLAVKALATVRS